MCNANPKIPQDSMSFSKALQIFLELLKIIRFLLESTIFWISSAVWSSYTFTRNPIRLKSFKVLLRSASEPIRFEDGKSLLFTNVLLLIIIKYPIGEPRMIYGSYKVLRYRTSIVMWASTTLFSTSFGTLSRLEASLLRKIAQNNLSGP